MLTYTHAYVKWLQNSWNLLEFRAFQYRNSHNTEIHAFLAVPDLTGGWRKDIESYLRDNWRDNFVSQSETGGTKIAERPSPLSIIQGFKDWENSRTTYVHSYYTQVNRQNKICGLFAIFIWALQMPSFTTFRQSYYLRRPQSWDSKFQNSGHTLFHSTNPKHHAPGLRHKRKGASQPSQCRGALSITSFRRNGWRVGQICFHFLESLTYHNRTNIYPTKWSWNVKFAVFSVALFQRVDISSRRHIGQSRLLPLRSVAPATACRKYRHRSREIIFRAQFCAFYRSKRLMFTVISLQSISPRDMGSIARVANIYLPLNLSNAGDVDLSTSRTASSCTTGTRDWLRYRRWVSQNLNLDRYIFTISRSTSSRFCLRTPLRISLVIT